MNIHTPPAKTIASVIFAAAGSPNYAHMITDDVIAHAATAMDKIAKAEVAAAIKAGNIVKIDPGSRPGGPSTSLRIARLIANGPMSRVDLIAAADIDPKAVTNGLFTMRKMKLLNPDYQTISLTPKGKAWLESHEAGEYVTKSVDKAQQRRIAVLQALAGGKAITAQIAEALGKDKSEIGGRIREMVKHGLIHSEKNPRNSNLPRILSLTVKGREMLEAHQ